MTWEITLRGRRRGERWCWKGEATSRDDAIAQARRAYYAEHKDWGTLVTTREHSHA